MNQTSLKAYYEIRDTLPERRREVLEQLMFYINTKKHSPTAQELTFFSAIPGAWKRLSELERDGAVHRDGTRQCTISAKHAATWAIGPKVEGELF